MSAGVSIDRGWPGWLITFAIHGTAAYLLFGWRGVVLVAVLAISVKSE